MEELLLKPGINNIKERFVKIAYLFFKDENRTCRNVDKIINLLKDKIDLINDNIIKYYNMSENVSRLKIFYENCKDEATLIAKKYNFNSSKKNAILNCYISILIMLLWNLRIELNQHKYNNMKDFLSDYSEIKSIKKKNKFFYQASDIIESIFYFLIPRANKTWMVTSIIPRILYEKENPYKYGGGSSYCTKGCNREYADLIIIYEKIGNIEIIEWSIKRKRLFVYRRNSGNKRCKLDDQLDKMKIENNSDSDTEVVEDDNYDSTTDNESLNLDINSDELFFDIEDSDDSSSNYDESLSDYDPDFDEFKEYGYSIMENNGDFLI